MSLRFYPSLIMLFLSIALSASEPADSVATSEWRPSKGNIIKRLINYFDESNKDKPMKRVDFSFIGGPSYSNDAKLGIGLVAAALYRTDMNDSLLQQSNVSLYTEVTTALLYMVGVRGNHIAPHEDYRINYDTKVYSFPTKFWGIGYTRAVDDANETSYKDFHVSLQGEILWQPRKNFFIGPTLEFCYTHAHDIKGDKGISLWEGQPLKTSDFGAGLTFSYDSRDHLTNPFSGWLFRVDQRFFPRFAGNGNHSFSLTEFGINKYSRIWRGGILAARLHGKFTYGRTPWGMLPTIGGSYTMRGYYEARYRDKCAMDLTVELRQHVWKRSGAVLWLGVGSVFPRFAAMRFDRLLPNAGIGYRWEFKKRTNVRLDFGVGKGQTGFIFNINEAF